MEGFVAAQPGVRGAVRAALNGIDDAVLIVDGALRVRLINDAARRLIGLGDQSTRGVGLAEMLAGATRFDPPAVALLLDRARALLSTETSLPSSELGMGILLAGRRISARGWMLTLTERRPRGAEPVHLDTLTGLPDRRSFNETLARKLVVEGEKTALLMVDLDRFKAVNDTLGHPVGDALLIAVAGRLKGCLRGQDLAVRLGGDEFAVLLPACARDEEATEVARRIVEMLSRPFLLHGQVASIGASVGIAFAPEDAAEPDELVRTADLALYQAKADGRGGWRRYDPVMNERAQARRVLEADLRKALVLRQFRLVYQPQIDMLAGRLTGFEALLRWAHPVRGLVQPNEFIPLAEEIGLIGPIGAWVLAEACAEAAGWPGGLRIAVNVSTLQFERADDLVRAVETALAAAGLPGHRLELEITESALLNNEKATLATLHKLRAMGVRIAMDDFGTGYSSLSQLRSFPFDKVKIDRSFVADLATSDQSSAIVRAITALGNSLGMTTIAEGVETEAQAAALVQDGCSNVQGFLISRPVPPGEVGGLIERYAPPASLLETVNPRDMDVRT